MKKESKYTTYIEWFLMFILFVGLMKTVFGSDMMQELKPEGRTQKILTFLGIILMMFVTLGAHELGHLLTGLANGFRFDLYVVGPLGVKREDDKVKFYLNKNLGYYGGVAGTSPREKHPDNAKKFARMILGGPIASLVFAVVCFLLAYFLGKPFGILFLTGAAVSVGLFFATTIPSRTGMFFTDRKRYQRLITPGKAQDVELATLNIMGSFAKNQSYKNIDRADIETQISDDLPLFKFMGLYNMICYQQEMKGEVDESIKSAYREVAKEIPKNIVETFDKELEKFREGLSKQL